ncbi:MAG: prephenate dehydrogenase/arogenate dehydrogenase family protein [Chloroflexota bacterium]
MQARTITIIGMQRLGVSIALALKKALPSVTIVGHDRDGLVTREVKEKLDAIDKAEWNLVKAAIQADILVLAIPLDELRQTLEVIGSDLQSHTLVLDLSSLKGRALKWASSSIKSGHYIGVRPILAAAALEDGRLGYEHASEELFQKSVFCLMPAADVDKRAVQTAVYFGHLLGATPYFLDPHEYDNLVQGVETVPKLLAAALFNAVNKETGWRDMLRFADQPFAVMTQPLGEGDDIAQLAFNDKAATLRWLSTLIEELQVMKQWIEMDDKHTLLALLGESAESRRKWLQERAENDWVEDVIPQVENQSLSDQLLGSWISDRMRNE